MAVKTKDDTNNGNKKCKQMCYTMQHVQVWAWNYRRNPPPRPPPPEPPEEIKFTHINNPFMNERSSSVPPENRSCDFWQFLGKWLFFCIFTFFLFAIFNAVCAIFFCNFNVFFSSHHQYRRFFLISKKKLNTKIRPIFKKKKFWN